MIVTYPNPLGMPVGTIIAGETADLAIEQGYAVAATPSRVKAIKKAARKQAKKSRRANR